MTETTEGLTRRTSSGSDSSAAGAGAAKTKRASSASHGGSLRFNIFRAFFSKGLIEPWLAWLFREGFSTGETQLRCSLPRPASGAVGVTDDYAVIFGEVNRFVTKLCRRPPGASITGRLLRGRASQYRGGKPRGCT